LQARDICSRPPLIAIALALAFLLVPAGAAMAQARADFYRAEIVIVERLVAPASVQEQMADKQVEPPLNGISSLWVVDASGNRQSDVSLAGRNELHLNQAAARLENSGNYRVLATAGWYQSFPPNYDGQPMKVAIGDWLSQAGQRAVEGHIEIDRQRYLHVNVHLNHWQDSGQSQPASSTAAEDGNQAENQLQPDAAYPSAAAAPAELITWIRETRRMRSEEIHFIDSPTIGVLVFFRRIEG